MAELIEKYLNKGDKIAVTGQLITKQYEKNGEKRLSFDILAENVDFLENKKTDDKVKGTLLDPNYNKSEADDDFPF